MLQGSIPEVIIDRQVVVNKNVPSMVKEHFEKSKQNIELQKEKASKDLKVKVAAPTREYAPQIAFSIEIVKEEARRTI